MIKRERVIFLQLIGNQKSQQGFALPLSVGVGITMLLLGTMMIARSNADRNSGIAQTQTAAALSVAESGVARTLSQLNSPTYSRLLTLNYDPAQIGDNTRAYLGPDQILRSNDETGNGADGIAGNADDPIINQWSTVPTGVGGCGSPTVANWTASLATVRTGNVGTGSNQGTYNVLAYRYNPATEIGTLLVEGTFRGSTSRVQVSVTKRTRSVGGSNGFPGLYATDSIDLGNNDVLKVVDASGNAIATETGKSANVICRNCTVPNNASNCSATGQPTSAAAAAAFNKKTNGKIDGQAIIAPSSSLPPVPTQPPIGSQGSYEVSTIDATYPRPGHQPDVNGVYHYKVNSITLTGGDNVTINTTSTNRVRFYVSGDIKLNGNGGFVHSGTPDRFAIIGTAPTSQTIKIGGGAGASNVFVYAPNATVGINGGGGSGKTNIKGAVWAKSWGLSSGNGAEIRVPDNMPELLKEAFGSSFTVSPGANFDGSSGPTNWIRQGAVR
jgi:hypothetical protein